MGNNNEKYFNAPIQLYQGFMIDSNNCLSNVANYACYEYTVKHGCSFKDAATYFNISFGGDNNKRSLLNAEAKGKQLYNSTPDKSPNVGIKLSTYWQYYKDFKTDFEKICLLAYLSIQSIVQKKSYCKIDNSFFLSRMDGNAGVIDLIQLSLEIKKYGKEYQLVKIKKELILNWNLKHYSRHTRGFYVSFSMNLEDLIYEAEKRRKSYNEKQLKEEEKKAVAKVLERLNNNTTNERP